MAAETLYRERRMSVAAIAQKLHVSKSTLYSYLRHRGVEIGPYGKQAVVLPSQSVGDGGGAIRTTTIILTPRIENNNKFVRGKKRTMENIERFCLEEYSAQRRPCGEYELKVPYRAVTKTSTRQWTNCWAISPVKLTTATASQKVMHAWMALIGIGDDEA